MSLKNKALIVNFNASQWTARKLDKAITNEVHTSHAASQDAGRYNKLLFAKDKTEPISKIVNAARTYHYECTLPWGDNGERLLTSAIYLDYVGKMSEFKNDFQDAVNHFLDNYDVFMVAERVRLNGMFKESDYPRKNEIREKFDFRTTFMPVPDSDIRVGLDDSEVDTLKIQIEAEINNRLSNAVSNVWERIKTQLSNMRDKLSDEKAIFRDSLFQNLKDLIEILPALNVTGDVNIARVCADMQGLIEDPNAIRSNPALRAGKAEEVERVMNKFKGFF